MKPGEFIFNGQSSTKFNTLMQVRPARGEGARSFTESAPSNRNGSVFWDLGVYNNFELDLHCFARIQKATDLDDLIDWLNTADYVDLKLYYDDQYTYKAICKNSVPFQAYAADHEYYDFTINLSVHPFKYLDTGLKQLSGTSLQVTNTTKYEAHPLITVTGKGDTTLTINADQTYTFKGLSGTITIDSEVPSCSLPAKYAGLEFPYLKTGLNTIKTSGTGLTIIPRFVRRAV